MSNTKNVDVYVTSSTTETEFGMGILTGNQEINYGDEPVVRKRQIKHT
ncbi:hypothetical protein [Virgibacillus kimchii]